MNTVHANALVIDGTGILILGPSGSGKSELALDLIDQCRQRSVPAVLVADDRLVLEKRNGAVWARVPPTIAGLIEVRGAGIYRLDFRAEAEMHMAVRLVDAAVAQRMPEDTPVEVTQGIALPCMALPRRSFAAVRAVLARLGHYGGIIGPISTP
jgi:serine kinase of HPr protein (carbohydrate metabolism regulator)